MKENLPSIFATLMGDIEYQPGARVKYGFFFGALERKFPLIEVFDAGLKGFNRVFNALFAFHFNRKRWRERFYKDVPSFIARSQKAAERVKILRDKIDLVLQIGVMLDASTPFAPNIIYTDYTAALSSRKPESGRSPFSEAKRRQWLYFERAAYERAAHICTRSEFVRTSIIEDYKIPPQKITAIGGGVNIAMLPEMVLRLENENPTVLFIGKDFYRKGGDILLKAFALARQKVPNARLFFVTADPIPPEFSQEGVAVIEPTWDRKSIANLYWRADIFVLPSRLETWGDVLLEAMSFGLPCIGVRGEAMEEIIINEETGIVVPSDNPEALAEALVRLLQDQTLRRTLGHAARKRIETYFTWDRVVERLQTVLMNVWQQTELCV